jgi:ribosome-associated protein
MTDSDGIEITASLRIPVDEIRVEFSRASGPGGQHVNKVETRVSLLFDLGASSVLSDAQRDRLMTRLQSRINKGGVLRVSCDSNRSQAANRVGAHKRLADLIREALKTPKKRVPTKPSRASQRRRMDDKKRRGDLKRGRGGGWSD